MTDKRDLNIACIVLAAGAGSRFGGAKLEHHLASGQTILQQTVSVYSDVFSQITVVLKEGDAALERQLSDLSVNLVFSKDSEEGMSQSLIAGLTENITAQACMIALGDMPYIHSSTIKALASQADKSKITLPTYNQKRGNPAIFGRDFYPDLLALKGDFGGKRLLEKHVNDLIHVDVDDPGIHQDIDCLEDVID